MNIQLLREIFISGLARHSTQLIGGALIGTGIGTESDASVIVGVGMSALAYGWSAWRKKRRARKAARV